MVENKIIIEKNNVEHIEKNDEKLTIDFESIREYESKYHLKKWYQFNFDMNEFENFWTSNDIDGLISVSKKFIMCKKNKKLYIASFIFGILLRFIFIFFIGGISYAFLYLLDNMTNLKKSDILYFYFLLAINCLIIWVLLLGYFAPRPKNEQLKSFWKYKRSTSLINLIRVFTENIIFWKDNFWILKNEKYLKDIKCKTQDDKFIRDQFNVIHCLMVLKYLLEFNNFNQKKLENLPLNTKYQKRICKYIKKHDEYFAKDKVIDIKEITRRRSFYFAYLFCKATFTPFFMTFFIFLFSALIYFYS